MTIITDTNTVYLIHEKDLEDGETDVIGVASNLEKVKELIDEHYGEFKEISYTDIRDSTLEYSKVIQVYYDSPGIYKYELTVQWFPIDSL